MKTNSWTTAGQNKALLQLANFTLGPNVILITEIHKKSDKGSQLSQRIKAKTQSSN